MSVFSRSISCQRRAPVVATVLLPFVPTVSRDGIKCPVTPNGTGRGAWSTGRIFPRLN
jgi:hypothetical protein